VESRWSGTILGRLRNKNHDVLMHCSSMLFHASIVQGPKSFNILCVCFSHPRTAQPLVLNERKGKVEDAEVAGLETLSPFTADNKILRDRLDGLVPVSFGNRHPSCHFLAALIDPPLVTFRRFANSPSTLVEARHR
jgi:hypothetical protein